MTVRREGRNRLFAYHLEKRRANHEFPSMVRRVRMVEKYCRSGAFAGQCSQGSIVGVGRFSESAQGRDFTDEFPGVSGTLREVRLARGERLPDDVVERMHGCV